MRQSSRHKSMLLVVAALMPAGLLSLLLFSCGSGTKVKPLSASDSVAIVIDNINRRAEVDSFFRYDDSSPFRRDTTISYRGIQWYPIDPHFRVASILHRYEVPETVSVMGTKGEERRELKYGYFAFTLPNEHGVPVDLKINVYKFTPYDSLRYLRFKNSLSVWFRDRTTGTETYDVGRYVDVGDEQPDPNYEYVIDFNKAYNPYCAYSATYSCARPRKEDYLDIYLRVGERKYHD
ncbi:MAG TPA: DUF1684 domain-containing protein [Bacteroidota bacterium]|nr:DUF1684 domain-containing protein [Bacteroidota bacterium]